MVSRNWAVPKKKKKKKKEKRKKKCRRHLGKRFTASAAVSLNPGLRAATPAYNTTSTNRFAFDSPGVISVELS